MSSSERIIDRGRRRGRYLRIELGRALRECRVAAGLSQAAVARAAGISPAMIGKIERAEIVGVGVQRMAELFAVVGHELAARPYPDGPPLRDKGQVAVFGRARTRAGPAWQWRYEVTLPIPGDARAWDATMRAGPVELAVEVESRLRDVQATLRRINGKARDDHRDRVILFVADTRANRAAVRAAATILQDAFPVAPTAAWAALRAGRDPGGNALLFV